MSKKRGFTEEEVELANLIWNMCEEGSALRDAHGKPSYFLALNLARHLLRRAYELGFDDPLSEIDWRAIIDCDLEYSEVISEYERWLRDHVGRAKSLDSIAYLKIDELRLNIESLKYTISQLEALTPDELREMGLTEEERRRQLEELRSSLAKLEAELKRTEWQIMQRMRIRVPVKAPEREATRKLIGLAVKKPETPLGRRLRQMMLWELPRKPVEEKAPPPVSEEEVFREAQRIYSEFMKFHSELEGKLKPVADKINELIKQLHSLEKQFMEASEAGDLERLKQLLPDAERVQRELSEAFDESIRLLRETLPARHEWRRRKDEALRKLFELKRKAPGKAEEIHKFAMEISVLSEPYIRWEAPPEWVHKDNVAIKRRAESLVKRVKSRIAELEYRQRRVGLPKRMVKDVLRYEDFINKIRERLEYYGVPQEIISRLIAEIESDLRQMYEETEYAELESAIFRVILYFKNEYLPIHFAVLPIAVLRERGVRVEHPREVVMYGFLVKPRVSYLKPRFDSWIRDCVVAGFTVKHKPISIKPGKTHIIVDPIARLEATYVAVMDETVYLINAPAIGYVYDPDNKYVEYYYYRPCPLLYEHA
jgi:hypothetical protein